MFHTFQSSVGLPPSGMESDGASNKPARTAGSRRISTSNACVECRRRKIRCDGSQPCGQCQWYQHPEACGYSKPAQRVVPSRKLVDRLSSNIEQYKNVLARLYPATDLDSLISMPREDLLELALSTPAEPLTRSPSTTDTQPISDVAHGSDGESLEALEQAPPEDPVWDEARKHKRRVQGISDDVNGLSMSVDRLSSYVGISSITAALKVIVKCAPQAGPLIAHGNQETALPSRANSPPPELEDEEPHSLPPQALGQELIKSYFERVHLFFPMIEEHKFWSTYLYGNRSDSAWLALLNMVFALGSLASSTSENEAHYIYFNRSRQHLSLESFGSGNLEVLQALAIMSGYYMHYLNRPNEAHSLMGGTLRMATALGLHREYSDTPKTKSGGRVNATAPGDTDSIPPEMRRRIWWSLFCLDAWASTTTGRPSLGRMGSSITVRLPGTLTNSAHPPQPNSPQHIDQLKVLPLIHASEFCKIATRIQVRLVESPLLTPSETLGYDAELVRWHEDLPSILSNMNESCPEFLHRVRFVMKWRYQNIRIVLHRPVLLSTALRRCPFNHLSADEKVAVVKCRMFAAKTIEDMAMECLPDLISGWNAVWFVFQACMVPLVSLFSDSSMPDEARKWRATIETALGFLDKSKPWSIAARRSADAVEKMYTACKVHFPEHRAPGQNEVQHTQPPQHQHTHVQPTQHPYPHFPINTNMPPAFDYSTVPDISPLTMNHQPHPDHDQPLNANAQAWNNNNNLSGFWDDMMWDTNLPDILDTSFGLVSGDYEFQGAAQDWGAPCWMQGN